MGEVSSCRGSKTSGVVVCASAETEKCPRPSVATMSRRPQIQARAPRWSQTRTLQISFGRGLYTRIPSPSAVRAADHVPAGVCTPVAARSAQTPTGTVPPVRTARPRLFPAVRKPPPKRPSQCARPDRVHCGPRSNGALYTRLSVTVGCARWQPISDKGLHAGRPGSSSSQDVARYDPSQPEILIGTAKILSYGKGPPATTANLR